jgi:alanyl aminopeptidase
VSALMSTWVSQPGFPLLSVEESEAGNTLHLTQSRFYLSSEEMGRDHPGDGVWPIPVVIRYGTANGIKEKRVLMKDKKMSVKLDERPQWVYPNASAIGFYRMHLSSEILQQLLAKGLSSLSAAERLGLLEDTWSLVRNGSVEITDFMDVLAAFAGESDYAVARAIAGRVYMLDQRLVEEKDRPLFAAFVERLFAPAMQKVGFEPSKNEGPEIAVLRATVVSSLGNVAGHKDTIEKARMLAERERKDPKKVEPNLAGTVVQLAAHSGDQKTLADFIATYKARVKAKTTPELQARYLGALPSFSAAKLVQNVLDLVLDGTVPQESLRSVIAPMLGRRQTQLQAWAFLKKNWGKIGPRIGAMGISRLVEATGALPPSQEKDVAAFFKKHPVPEAARALKKALEAMALNRDLISREGRRLSAWLQEHAQSAEAA